MLSLESRISELVEKSATRYPAYWRKNHWYFRACRLVVGSSGITGQFSGCGVYGQCRRRGVVVPADDLPEPDEHEAPLLIAGILLNLSSR